MQHILRCYGDIYDTTIVRGAGCYVYDALDNRFVDFESGVWSAALGHGNPRINHVLHRQLDEIMHLGYRYKSSIVEEAAQAVLNIAGLSSGKAVFLCSGSEAVEFGIQAVRRLTSRPLLLGLKGSYLGAFGLAGAPSTKEWHMLDWDNCSACTEQCGDQCPHIQAIPFERIGAFVFEPGNTSGLVKLPPAGLVSTLVTKTRESGGFIVANEVTAGLGRTGKWFGYQHYGLQPDIVAMGKHLGNGYPVSAVAMGDSLARCLESSGFRYAQSHQNDALGCAVAREVVNILKDEKLIERSEQVGGRFITKLEALCHGGTNIVDVRGRGLMIAVEVNHPSLANVHKTLFERGYIVGVNVAANVLRFYPPLIIHEQDINAMLQELTELLVE